MLDWLYEFLGSMLYGFSSLFGGKYVFGLLIYALIFKVLFLPFSIKQQKNQIKMAALAPKIELIKAKYRGRTDQPTLQKQQQEIMELQQKEGYSPFSGCLPLLLQMPIIIFLYSVIRNPLSYICRISKEGIVAIYQALNADAGDIAFGSIDQIKLVSQIRGYEGTALEGYDFSRLPDFDLFGLDLSETPSFTNLSLLVLIPVIAAALTYLSMVLTRKWNGNNMAAAGQDAQSQASMKIMDLMMPLMTLWFAFNFSGMLGVYWIYQSALGIVQTYALAKAMPLPKYSEEELREMKKRQKEVEKNQHSIAKNAPKVRSLHYIDEDDYEELPEVKTENKKNNSGIDIPDIKD